MKKKLLVSLLILLSVLFFDCNSLCNNIEEDKKILVLGNVIGISGFCLEENYNKEDSDLIKTSVNNAGIMTGIDLETMSYTAFGHMLNYNKKSIDLENTKCYAVECYDIQKSKNGKVGKLKVDYSIENEIGTVTDNNNKGVFGKINDTFDYSSIDSKELCLGSKYSVRLGKAKLYLNLDGNGIKEYDIVIDFINYFNETKNIHIKVVDEELIKLTGGVVKGMSGTPIVQNGRLVGSINCTSESNFCEAYGIFADEIF